MKSRRYQQLRKNPLIRLLRMIYRALKVIFQPKRKRLALATIRAQKELEARAALDAFYAQKELEHRIALEESTAREELENRLKEQFLTVGELLERVKWQIQPTPDLPTNSMTPKYDVSRN